MITPINKRLGKLHNKLHYYYAITYYFRSTILRLEYVWQFSITYQRTTSGMGAGDMKAVGIFCLIAGLCLCLFVFLVSQSQVRSQDLFRDGSQIEWDLSGLRNEVAGSEAWFRIWERGYWTALSVRMQYNLRESHLDTKTRWSHLPFHTGSRFRDRIG